MEQNVDDERMQLISEYREAVAQLILPSIQTQGLLDPEIIARLSDDELVELIRKYREIKDQENKLSELKEEVVAKSPAKWQQKNYAYYQTWMRYLICAVPPIGTLVYVFFATRAGGNFPLLIPDKVIQDLIRTPPDTLKIHVGRVVWGGANGVYFAACAATIYFGLFYIIPKALERRPGYIPRAIFLAVVPALIVGVCHPSFQNYSAIPSLLLRLTVKKDWPCIDTALYRFEGMVFFMFTFLTAIGLIIIWAVSKDINFEKLTRSDLEDSEHRLIEHMNLLRLLLYFGTAVLVTEIILGMALLYWPITYLNLYEGRSVEPLASAIITQRGVNHTLFLAALYIPAFLVFRNDAFRLAQLKFPGTPLAVKATWLKEQGVDYSIWEYWPRLLAILSPLLSKPLAELLNQMF
jgi:hypothetical protein